MIQTALVTSPSMNGTNLKDLPLGWSLVAIFFLALNVDYGKKLSFSHPNILYLGSSNSGLVDGQSHDGVHQIDTKNWPWCVQLLVEQTTVSPSSIERQIMIIFQNKPLIPHQRNAFSSSFSQASTRLKKITISICPCLESWEDVLGSERISPENYATPDHNVMFEVSVLATFSYIYIYICWGEWCQSILW